MEARAPATESQDALGTAGLYLFAFSAWSVRPLAVVGCLLMLWALWSDRTACWPALRRDPLTWVLVALAGYALLYAPVAALAEPSHWEQHVKHAARVVYYAGLIPVAWYLRADEGRVLRSWALVAAGFVCARVLYLGELDGFGGHPDEARLGLGLEPISFAYYAGTLLLAVLVFGARCLRRLRGSRRTLGTLALLLLAVLLLEGVVLSGTRSAWLALLPLLVIVGTAGLVHTLRRRNYRAALAVKVLALVVAGPLLLALPTIGERLATERHTLAALWGGNFDRVTTRDAQGRENSIGIRIIMLREGLARWRQAPLFGHGPAAAKLTLGASEVPLLSRFNDYHNVQLDILVRYGLLGLSLFTAALLLTLAGFRRGWRAGALSGDTALFLGCVLALLLASTLTNVRLLNWDFRYWVFLVAGPMASYRYYCRP